MRPLTRPARDPAPSRLAYRLNRLMLTPGFRRFLFAGLPAIAVSAAVLGYLGDAGRRAAIVASVEDMRRQIETRPEFMVRMMAVNGASPAVDAAIRETVAVDFPLSSFDLDLDAIHAQVAGLEAVRAASVRVRSGGILDVTVTERAPVALWRGGAELTLIDPEGYRLGTVERRIDRPDLPLVAGPGAERAIPEALALLAIAGPVEDRIRGLVRVGERRWDLVLDRDQRILLPETGAEAALARVMDLNRPPESLLSRDASHIDLRNPDRLTLRLAPAAIDALRSTYDTDSTGAF